MRAAWIRAVRTRALALAALAALAALINIHAPTVFFDIQLMLGSAVAVLALLLFGWSGLLVGATALAVTVLRWGHPFELLIGMGLLIWLRWFLDRLNGGRSRQANGRIVLAAIAYWLLFGIPAEMLLFSLRLRVDGVKALGLGIKEAVVSVLCTALGLLAYVLWRAWRGRGRKGQLSVRSISFVAVLLAVSLPGVLITLILSGQLKATALQAQLQTMQQVAREAAGPGALRRRQRGRRQHPHVRRTLPLPCLGHGRTRDPAGARRHLGRRLARRAQPRRRCRRRLRHPRHPRQRAGRSLEPRRRAHRPESAPRR